MMEPVAWRWKFKDAEEWGGADIKKPNSTQWRLFDVEPLVPQSAFSDAEARIEAERQAAINRAEVELLKLTDDYAAEVERRAAAEARAEAAEALLKEAGKALGALLRDLEMRATTLKNGTKQVDVSDGVYHRARAIHHKPGVKDE